MALSFENQISYEMTRQLNSASNKPKTYETLNFEQEFK